MRPAQRPERRRRPLAAMTAAVLAVVVAGTSLAPAAGAATPESRVSVPAAERSAGAPAATTIRFGTYNVRTSGLNNAWAGDHNSYYDKADAQRMAGVAGTIRHNKLEIVAVQEARTKERAGILQHLPDRFRATGVKGRSDGVIFWDNSVWQKRKIGWYAVPIRQGINRPMPWLELKHRRTGERLVVIDVHFAAGNREPFRVAGAKATVATIKKVATARKLPFILAGDINGNDRDPHRIGAYQRFKKAGFRYTRTAAAKVIGNGCDSHNSRAGHGKQECGRRRGSHIDMVWVSRSVKVDRYHLIANANTSRHSDHNPIMTLLRLPKRAETTEKPPASSSPQTGTDTPSTQEQRAQVFRMIQQMIKELYAAYQQTHPSTGG